MSAISSLTYYDGAGTPVAHTLAPVSVSREKTDILAEWREQLSTVPVDAQVRLTARLTTLKTMVRKVELRLVVPVMETVTNANAAGYTAAPKVAYENTVVITGFFHPRSDIAGRRLVRQMAANVLNHNTATLTPNTTGPGPELFDQLINAT